MELSVFVCLLLKILSVSTEGPQKYFAIPVETEGPHKYGAKPVETEGPHKYIAKPVSTEKPHTYDTKSDSEPKPELTKHKIDNKEGESEFHSGSQKSRTHGEVFYSYLENSEKLHSGQTW